jgi:hypothetical protein
MTTAVAVLLICDAVGLVLIAFVWIAAKHVRVDKEDDQ